MRLVDVGAGVQAGFTCSSGITDAETLDVETLKDSYGSAFGSSVSRDESSDTLHQPSFEEGASATLSSKQIMLRKILKKDCQLDEEQLDFYSTTGVSSVALIPESTPKMCPYIISKTWWNEFKKVQKMHRDGWSLTDIENASHKRNSWEWLNQNNYQQAILPSVWLELSESDKNDIEKTLRRWVIEKLNQWYEPSWLHSEEKELLHQVSTLEGKMRKALRIRLTPQNVIDYSPELYENIRLFSERLNSLVGVRYTLYQAGQVMDELCVYIDKMEIDVRTLPPANEIYRITKTFPETELSKRLWESRLKHLLQYVRFYRADSSIQTEINHISQQVAANNFSGTEMTELCNRLDSGWTANTLIIQGFLPEKQYRIVTAAPATSRERSLLEQRLQRLVVFLDKYPELATEHHRNELKVGLEYYKPLGKSEELIRVLDKTHPMRQADKVSRDYVIQQEVIETKIQKMNFDTRLKKLLLLSRCSNEGIPMDYQQELQKACFVICKGHGLDYQTIESYFNSIDPEGGWCINQQDSKVVFFLPPMIPVGYKPNP